MAESYVAPTITHSTWTMLGSEVSWDGTSGFICVDHTADPGCAWASARQVELRLGLVVDLDADGRVRGIETFGREAGVFDLLAVIQWMNEVHRG